MRAPLCQFTWRMPTPHADPTKPAICCMGGGLAAESKDRAPLSANMNETAVQIRKYRRQTLPTVFSLVGDFGSKR